MLGQSVAPGPGASQPAAKDRKAITKASFEADRSKVLLLAVRPIGRGFLVGGHDSRRRHAVKRTWARSGGSEATLVKAVLHTLAPTATNGMLTAMSHRAARLDAALEGRYAIERETR